MSYEKKLAALQQDALLASWDFSQQEWDSYAVRYAREKAPWGLALQILFPFVLFLFLLNVFRTRTADDTQAVGGTISLWMAIPALLVLLVGVGLLFWWFNTKYFPRPVVGRRPRVVMSKKGVLLGDRLFIWDQTGLNLIKTEVTGVAEGLPVMVLTVAWGMGAGKVIIPVPKGQAARAADILANLTVKPLR